MKLNLLHLHIYGAFYFSRLKQNEFFIVYHTEYKFIQTMPFNMYRENDNTRFVQFVKLCDKI